MPLGDIHNPSRFRLHQFDTVEMITNVPVALRKRNMAPIKGR